MQNKSDRTWLKLALESAGEEALLDKMANNHPGSTPTAFISYSWDTEEHKAWVREFAARLRADGIVSMCALSRMAHRRPTLHEAYSQ